MAPRRESALEQWAVAWARFRGIIAAKLKEVDGIPDRIFFVPGGRPIVIEFKRSGSTGRKRQVETQPWYKEALTKAGYRVYTCDTKEQFSVIMKDYALCRPKQ